MSATNGIASEFELITAPEGSVVSLTELKRHLKVDGNEREADITAFGIAAVDFAQKFTRRQFLTSTWRLHLSGFAERICLRKCPVQSITSITYLDAEEESQTLDSEEYQLLIPREPAEVRIITTPITAVNSQAVAVNFVAGYGAAGDVPELIKSAIKLKVEGLFYGCEEELKPTIEALLNTYCWGI